MTTFSFRRDETGRIDFSPRALAECERQLAPLGLSASIQPAVQYEASLRLIELARAIVSVERCSFNVAAARVNALHPALARLSRADLGRGGTHHVTVEG